MGRECDGRLDCIMAGPLLEVNTLVNGMLTRGTKLESAQFGKIAEAVGRVFSVRADEVAMLSLAEDGRFLRFCVPEQLQTVGGIPITSGSALAARTTREKRAEIVNNFSIVPHASVFEAVRLNNQRGEPIQKIMSAPILNDGKVLGVIQVSRKAKLATSASDFTANDLKHLVSIAELLAPALSLSSE